MDLIRSTLYRVRARDYHSSIIRGACRLAVNIASVSLQRTTRKETEAIQRPGGLHGGTQKTKSFHGGR